MKSLSAQRPSSNTLLGPLTSSRFIPPTLLAPSSDEHHGDPTDLLSGPLDDFCYPALALVRHDPEGDPRRRGDQASTSETMAGDRRRRGAQAVRPRIAFSSFALACPLTFVLLCLRYVVEDNPPKVSHPNAINKVKRQPPRVINLNDSLPSP